MVVALLTGVATGIAGPSEMSAVRSVVPPEQLSTALSQSQARQHVGALLGGPLGGILYGVTRWLPFAFDAVSFAAYWLLAGRLRTDLSAPRHDGPRRKPRQDVAEGIRFVLSWPYFRALVVWSALVNLLVNAMFFVALLRLVQEGFARRPSAWSPPPPASPASWARSPRRGSSSGCRPARSWSWPPGASCRSWCRWRCGTTRPWSRPASPSACCSTRPATPAARLPDRAHPRPPAGPGGVRPSFLSMSVIWVAPLLGGVLLEASAARRRSPSSAAWSR